MRLFSGLSRTLSLAACLACSSTTAFAADHVPLGFVQQAEGDQTTVSFQVPTALPLGSVVAIYGGARWKNIP